MTQSCLNVYLAVLNVTRLYVHYLPVWDGLQAAKFYGRVYNIAGSGRRNNYCALALRKVGVLNYLK